MSTDLKTTIDHLKRLHEHFEGRVNEQRRRKETAETEKDWDWWADQERKEQSDIVDPLVRAITLLESTGKDTEMLDFVIRCLNEKTPDEFNAMVWREFHRGSSRFDRGSITAAMQKESEVAK